MHWFAFWALVLLAVLLRCAAFQGYSDSDPRAYAVIANDLANGILSVPGYQDAPVFPLRIGTYGPVAALIKGYGLSEITLVAYPFVVSIAGCLLVYFFARHIFSPLAALFSLSLIAVVPLDVEMASLLYADAIAAFWANLAVVCAWLAIYSSTLRRTVLLSCASGVSFGISWLCKETVVYLLPFVLVLIFLGNRRSSTATKSACFVAIGTTSALVLAAEIAGYTLLTGDPLFRLHETERNYEWWPVWFFHNASPLYGWKEGEYFNAVVKRLLYEGPRGLALVHSMAFLPLFGIVAALWAVVFKYWRAYLDSRAYLVIAWLISLILMFNFMSTSLSSYKPMVLYIERYLYPLMFPAILLAGASLAKLASEESKGGLAKKPHFWCAVGFAGLLGASALQLPSLLMSRTERLERQVNKRLKQDDVVFTDYRTSANLVFFRETSLAPFDARTRQWEEVREDEIPSGTYVLVHRTKIDFLAKSYKYVPPSYASHPPSSWRKVASYSDGDLYLVNGDRPASRRFER